MPGTNSNQPNEVKQANLHNFLSGFNWPDELTSSTCQHYGRGEETVEHLLLLCPQWEAERQCHFGKTTNVSAVSRLFTKT